MIEETTIPRMARNLDEFLGSLFKGPTTFDGYVIKKKKDGQIKLWAWGENYVLNLDHVFCLATKLPDGRTWYSYGGRLNQISLQAQQELEKTVKQLAEKSA